MSNVLLFFVFPVATILLSIVLERVLESPTLVAMTFFAAYLIVAFTAYTESFLIYAIIYVILAYLTAVMTRCLSRAGICQRIGSLSIEKKSNSIINEIDSYSNNYNTNLNITEQELDGRFGKCRLSQNRRNNGKF